MPEPGPAPVPIKVALVLSADLAPGAAANVAACLSAGLSAARPGWAGQPLADAAGLASVASSHLPITILRAEREALQAIVRRLAEGTREPDALVSLFPAYAQAMHEAEAYWERHARTSHVEHDLLGLGLHGPKRWVARLSGSLPLWR